jgi:Uma2 family endonuclease
MTLSSITHGASGAIADGAAIAQNSQLSLSGVTWEQFELVEEAFAGIGGVRFIYFDGVLEIMTPSADHEDYKSTIGLLIEAYMRKIGVRFYRRGSATLGKKALGGRKEPDESYNFEVKKPIPDLVVEVIITSGSINLLQLYQRLGVPEVWLWQDGVLEAYYLANDSYLLIDRSHFLPDLDLNLLARYINYHDQYDAVIEFINELKP